MTEISPEQLLDALDPEQRHVAEILAGPMSVLAGAGTGKTRAITHRIAYGVASGAYDPSTVLAVTFTARAAAEMRTRLRALGAPTVQARTFHAAALRQLQYFWADSIGGQVPVLLDHKAGLITEAARRLRFSVDRATIRDIAAEVEWAKVSMLTPESYVRAATGRAMPPGLDQRSIGRIFQGYEDLKSDRNAIDFEDVLLITVGLLEEDERVAAAVRQQYKHFVVDEFQDVSPLQYRLLSLWLGGRQELCVVGDASQTIYSFTGARSSYLTGFAAQFPEATLVKLIRDYRSTPQVVALANSLLAGRKPERRLGPAALKTPWTPPLELVAQRDAGPEPTFFEAADDEDEAAKITAAIRTLLDKGVRAQNIAILYRTNGQSEAYEQALAAANISYQLRGAERFFSRREIREAIAALKSASLTPDGEPIVDRVKDVLAPLGYTSAAPQGSGAVRERWESLSALVLLAEELDAARRHNAAEPLTMREFVTELLERATTQHAPQSDGVTLASLHSAKGLEWEAVFLAGLSEGLMPISFANTQADLDEERRLLYVGITRAKRFLSLSWSRSRTAGGRGNRQPSRFLDGLRPESATHTPRESAPPRTRKSNTRTFSHCRVCGNSLATGRERKIGRCGDCPPSYSEKTFEALRQWRLDTAREADVPAFVVFTDATLTAIAELTPGSLSELGTISGVGSRKLELYGDAVLTVLGRIADDTRNPGSDVSAFAPRS